MIEMLFWFHHHQSFTDINQNPDTY
jgi:hypothetical protein